MSAVVPITDTPSYTSYPVTPILSVEAVQAKSVVVVVVLEAVRFVGAVGGSVSGPPVATNVILSMATSALWVPQVSRLNRTITALSPK